MGLVLVGAGAVVAVREVGPTVRTALERIGAAEPVPVDVRLSGVLVVLGATVAALAWAWLVLCLLVAASDAVRGGRVPAGGLFRPVLLRGVLGAACVSAGTLAGPAYAVEPQQPALELRAESAGFPALLLDGLLLPDRVTDEGPDPRRQAGPKPPPASSPRTDQGAYRVRPGDTLWELAEELLVRSGSRFTTADVAEGSRLLHSANRAAVGSDPDLIRPGTVLRIPAELTGADR